MILKATTIAFEKFEEWKLIESNKVKLTIATL